MFAPEYFQPVFGNADFHVASRHFSACVVVPCVCACLRVGRWHSLLDGVLLSGPLSVSIPQVCRCEWDTGTSMNGWEWDTGMSTKGNNQSENKRREALEVLLISIMCVIFKYILNFQKDDWHLIFVELIFQIFPTVLG